MKFTLTITDMTPEDLTEVVTGLGYADHPLSSHTITQTDDEADEYDNTAPEAPSPFDVTVQASKRLNCLLDAELDSTGLPWDERIHASTKTKKQDGSWKARKGVDDAVRNLIETELRNNKKAAALPTDAISVYATAPAAPIYTPPVPAAPTYPPQVTAPAAPIYTPPAPAAPIYTPPVPAAPTYPPQVTAPVGNTMQSLMGKFQELLMAKKIQPNFAMQMVQDLNAMYGTTLSSVVDLGQNQQMLDAAVEYINQRVQ